MPCRAETAYICHSNNLGALDRYGHTLAILYQYDHQSLRIAYARSSGQQPISYGEAMAQIRLWRQKE